jgi:methionyl-tRNA synthetase
MTLANDLGNLLNRTVAMVNKYCDGMVPAYKSLVTDFDSELSTTAANVVSRYRECNGQNGIQQCPSRSVDAGFSCEQVY